MNVTPSSDPTVAICAIAKNEGPYLAEWAVYHRLLGFGPILVYDHESTDDSSAVLGRLAERGLAEGIEWSVPPETKPQWLAYENGLERLRARADWVAFVDLDEFFVLPRHPSIQAFLAEYDHLDAIGVNWKMFGSSGHETRTEGLVIERFTRCAEKRFRGNRAVKTLARIDAIQVPRVHTCVFQEGVRYRTVFGEEIPASEGRTQEVSHGFIRLNHYFTRSREEWEQKAAKGKGAKPTNHPRKHRTGEEFEANDRNEDEEHEIVTFVERVRETLRTGGLV